MKKVRNCKLIGGMMDGWSGEYLDTGQTLELFGPPGECNYAYRRSEQKSTDKMAVWVYDQQLTEFSLRSTGLDPEAAKFANPAYVPPGAIRPSRPEGDGDVRIEGDKIKLRMEVRHNRDKKRAELWIGGKCIEAGPLSVLESPELAQEWLAGLGVTEILQ